MSLCLPKSITYYAHLCSMLVLRSQDYLIVRHGVIRHIIDGQHLPLTTDHLGMDNREANQMCLVNQPVCTSSIVRGAGKGAAIAQYGGRKSNRSSTPWSERCCSFRVWSVVMRDFCFDWIEAFVCCSSTMRTGWYSSPDNLSVATL